MRAQLLLRAARAGLTVSDPLAEQLAAYLGLLFRWDKKINLTGLTSVDGAIDRLLLEPIAAVRWMPSTFGSLIDVGSGGGSPAIPLKLALPQLSLTMVEVKERKASFLREAIRVLSLSATRVENVRSEALASLTAFQGTFDLVSVRAVRLDHEALTGLLVFLRPSGLLVQFHTITGEEKNQAGARGLSGIAGTRTVPLLESTKSAVTLFTKG